MWQAYGLPMKTLIEQFFQPQQAVGGTTAGSSVASTIERSSWRDSAAGNTPSFSVSLGAKSVEELRNSRTTTTTTPIFSTLNKRADVGSGVGAASTASRSVSFSTEARGGTTTSSTAGLQSSSKAGGHQQDPAGGNHTRTSTSPTSSALAQRNRSMLVASRPLALQTYPVYTVYKELADEWAVRLSVRQPGPTQFGIKGDGVFRGTLMYATNLDYSYSILAEYVPYAKLREAAVSHNNSTVLADPMEQQGLLNHNSSSALAGFFNASADSVRSLVQQSQRASSSNWAQIGQSQPIFPPPEEQSTAQEQLAQHQENYAIAQPPSSIKPPDPAAPKVRNLQSFESRSDFSSGSVSRSSSSVSDDTKDAAMQVVSKTLKKSSSSRSNQKMNQENNEQTKGTNVTTSSNNKLRIQTQDAFLPRLRELTRMSDTQRRRVQYRPHLPQSLLQYRLVDRDGYGVCSELKFLEKLFPATHKLKAIRVDDPVVKRMESSAAVTRDVSVTSNVGGIVGAPAAATASGGAAGAGSASLNPQATLSSSSGAAPSSSQPFQFLPPPRESQATTNYSGVMTHPASSSSTTRGPQGRRTKPLKLGIVCLSREAPGIHNAVWGALRFVQENAREVAAAREQMFGGGADMHSSGSMSDFAPSPPFSTNAIAEAGTTSASNVANYNQEDHNFGPGAASPSAQPTGHLYGFLGGGRGLCERNFIEIDEQRLLPYCNQAGLDLLQRSDFAVTRTEANLTKVVETVLSLELDGLLVIGNSQSHPETAFLAEYFLEFRVPCAVVGIPASCENDLPFVEQSLGHDTACKVFSSIIGNLGAHAASTKKHWYFIRVAGRSVSRIVNECCLQTQPSLIVSPTMGYSFSQNRTTNTTVNAGIGTSVGSVTADSRLSLASVTDAICDVIEQRADRNMNYGVVLIPDGLLALIPEMRELVEEVNAIHKSKRVFPKKVSDLVGLLSPFSHGVFSNLPDQIQYQILTFASPSNDEFHSRYVDVANIEAELLLRGLVESELSRRKGFGQYRGGGFLCHTHSLSHQARSALPTNHDCNLGYTLGYTAALFALESKTGLLVTVENQATDSVDNWIVGGAVLSHLVSIKETNIGIRRTDKAARAYSVRMESAHGPDDLVSEALASGQLLPPPVDREPVNPGPVQFSGPLAETKLITQRLLAPSGNALRQVEKLCKEIKLLASANCRSKVLDGLCAYMKSGLDLVNLSTSSGASATNQLAVSAVRPRPSVRSKSK
ncbi:unnamed protein product [Amoebophrya sp. A120]|nr:unnamed protein product [Amoebophrya sp. A120]|eukprot:GSA120T00001117001.1